MLNAGKIMSCVDSANFIGRLINDCKPAVELICRRVCVYTCVYVCINVARASTISSQCHGKEEDKKYTRHKMRQ